MSIKDHFIATTYLLLLNVYITNNKLLITLFFMLCYYYIPLFKFVAYLCSSLLLDMKYEYMFKYIFVI
jgi:hypothetical protein